MSQAERAAFGEVSPTCPRVDKAHDAAFISIETELERDIEKFLILAKSNISDDLKEFVRLVKIETESLRDALISAHEDRIAAEDKNLKLEDMISILESREANLQKEVRELELKIETLESSLDEVA